MNRGMADYGEAHSTDAGMSSALSARAVTIGGVVIVPALVSVFGTGKQMQLAQRVASARGGSAAVYLRMSIIRLVSIFAPAYLQAELNNGWQTELTRPSREPVAATAVAA